MAKDFDAPITIVPNAKHFSGLPELPEFGLWAPSVQAS